MRAWMFSSATSSLSPLNGAGQGAPEGPERPA